MWTTENARIDAQLAGLKTALTIAIVLDRVLILPRFHCFSKSTGSYVECPLNSLLGITAFDAGFGSRYRESSFLRHPLVPDAVRHNVSLKYFISTPATTNTVRGVTRHTNETIAVRQYSTDSISADQLRQLLGIDQHRVLSLASLERVRVTFKSADRQRIFDETVNASFKRSDYRQFAYN